MEIPANFKYKDIIFLGRPIHGKNSAFYAEHPPMPASRWAKIYAPFDALRGFNECIAEQEVVRTARRTLDEDAQREMNRKLEIPELLSYSRKDLLKRARNLGVRTLDEIAVELEKAGYKEAFLRFALPECTMDEVEKARQDPESTLTLDPAYCYRLYRAGIKTLDQIGEYDEHTLLNKGLCKADLEKIQLLFSD